MSDTLNKVLDLAWQALRLVPEMAAIGVSVAPLLAWGREVLESNAAPGHAEYDRLEAFVSEWQGLFRSAAAPGPGEEGHAEVEQSPPGSADEGSLT